MDAKALLVGGPLPALEKLKRSARSANFQANRKSSKTPARLISIIIPAHNEERYLEHTLRSLQRQRYRQREVIVVANGCTDRTAEVANGRCDRLIVLSQKSLGVARNLGARMARGEILIFLDADTTFPPNGLRVIAREFSTGDTAATLKGRPDSTRFAYRLLYLTKNIAHRWITRHGSSGVIICWKKDFVRAGGFDERLEVRENSELIKRLKRFGRYKYIGKVAATTSMRRYEQRGFRHMIRLWTRLWLQSLFGNLRNRSYETVR